MFACSEPAIHSTPSLLSAVFAEAFPRLVLRDDARRVSLESHRVCVQLVAKMFISTEPERWRVSGSLVLRAEYPWSQSLRLALTYARETRCL